MKNLITLALVFFTGLSQAEEKLFCDERNYKEFIYDIDKTNKLVEQTGEGCQLRDIFLKGADLQFAYFYKADLLDAFLREANLSHANFHKANLKDVDLFNAILHRADLTSTRLIGASLREADLTFANLNSASLWSADLRGADFSNANLRNTLLIYANLGGAILYGSDLSGAKINDRTNLDFAKYNIHTDLPGIDIFFSPKQHMIYRNF